MRIQVHELDAHFLERSVAEKMPLDSGKSLMWVIVCLLNQSELFSLRLIEARLDRIGLFQPFQAEHEQLGVILVVQWRERYVLEFAGLKPMHSRGIDCDSLFSGGVWAVFQEVVLSFLLRLQVQSREAAKILLAHCLVDCGPSSDPFLSLIHI